MSNKSGILIPKALIEHLSSKIEKFKYAKNEDQASIAALVWMSSSNERAHRKYDGYFSMHHSELREIFGSNLHQVNATYNFLAIKESWKYNSTNDLDDGESYTKGYRLTKIYQEALIEFLDTPPKTTKFIDLSLRNRKKPASAIQSKDSKHVTTNRWGEIAKSRTLSMPSVNQQKINDLINDCIEIQKIAKIRSKHAHHINRIRVYAKKLLWLLQQDEKSSIFLAHTYIESPSGRLYAQGGVNLQNAPRILRKAALAGNYDYDIENCHISIIGQLAALNGLATPEINHYLENKNKMRKEIATETDSSIKQVKEGILALLYGAPLSSGCKTSISEIFGRSAAQKFTSNTKIKSLYREISQARELIVNSHVENRQGGIVNMFGKSISKKNLDTPKIFAHIQQGIEATALRACLRRCHDKVLLLQHDGFTSIERLNKFSLESSILQDTKIYLTLEESKLSYSRDDLEIYLNQL